MRSDAALLAAARTDAGAFRELYDRYAERVLGYHLRRTRDEDAAHELTAETFAHAWVARGRFRDECDGTAGLERLGIEVAASSSPQDDWLDGLDDFELPEAVRLRVVHELSYDEIADALDTTPGAARVRVHRGLASLRTRLSKETR